MFDSHQRLVLWYDYYVPYTGERKRDYQRARRLRNREEAIRILGGVCVVCGTSENLEFDHKDPASKDPRLGYHGVNFNWRWSWILEEIAKCQLLCHKHHQEKSIRQGEYSNPGRPGETNSHAKLTEDDVRYIRKSELSSVLLAKTYGIHWATVSKIKKRQRWACVSD